jgi:ABC-2 type transport system permease protein
MIALTMFYPVILAITGNPDWGPILTSALGTLLLSSSYLAMGILFSAMTENQIVAGALTFAGTLFFWLIAWASQSAGPVWGDVLNYLSLINHYMQSFSQGTINTTDVIFYASFIGFMLFLTHRVLDSFRWR